jgi:uncharacterized membrane protein
VVDLGRGAVMAIMALDHTRTFLTNVPYNPSDLTRTFPALFLTRWISHFCTPLFLFLAGSGAYFMTTRRERRTVAWFLATRGLVLVALELTAVRWGWYFNVDYRHTSLQILWAIGASMILLAPLVFLPTRVAGAVGIAVVALHNRVGPWISDALGGKSWAWALLYERGRELAVVPEVVVVVNFPVLPLFGVMAMGYAFGEFLHGPAAERRRACLGAGAAFVVAFVALRFFNLYGDPLPWAPQADAVYTLLSFLSLTKHPLSLSMTLATLGPALLWLGVVRADRPIWRPLLVIGRVPMAFYLVHVPVIHAFATAYSLAFHGTASWLLTSPFDRGPADVVPDGFGFGLPGVYLCWVLLLLILYPLCDRFAGLKARSRPVWLSYL